MSGGVHRTLSASDIPNGRVCRRVTNEETGEANVNGMCAHLKYSPMDGLIYVERDKDYYTDSCISTPMHADLEFDELGE